MIRHAVRGLALAGVIGLTAAAPAAPAAGAENDLGWLRVTPATGTTFDAIDTPALRIRWIQGAFDAC